MNEPLQGAAGERAEMTTIYADSNKADKEGRIPSLLKFAKDPDLIQPGASVLVNDEDGDPWLAKVEEVFRDTGLVLLRLDEPE